MKISFLNTTKLNGKIIFIKFILFLRCPISNQHDRANCIYAHNVQDYRRDLSFYSYSNEDCPKWNKSDNVKSYEEGFFTIYNIIFLKIFQFNSGC